jgi:uncharacterized membrane protein
VLRTQPHLERLRLSVAPGPAKPAHLSPSPLARDVVIACALALTLATWGYLPLALLGLPVERWESFVFDACGPFCHQMPSRSFHVASHTLPLCARCTGMWLGITLGVVMGLLVKARRRWLMGSLVALTATLVSGVDKLRENAGGASQPWIRAIFGLLLFLGVTWAVSEGALGLIARLGRRCLKRARVRS